jgi:hypothetical protein
MFERWPNANVAIATGLLSDTFVVDEDPRHTGDASLEALENQYGRLPETPTVLTGGGGLHFYFRRPAGIDIHNSSGQLGAGLDVKGAGGYVIAPPSRHISGRRYCWELSARIGEVPLAEAPEWLLKLILNPPDSPHGTSNGQRLTPAQVSFARLVSGIPEGKRDQELFRLAASMRRQGYSRPFVEQVVVDAARRCKPPFPDRVAHRKVASAWRYR